MEQQTQQMDHTFPLVPPPINEHGRIDTGTYLRYVMYVYQFFILALQVVAMPGELLIRKRFGERYLDPLMVLLGFGGIFMIGAGRTVGSGKSYGLVTFAFVYLTIAIIHRLAIFHRDLKGETWHSHSAGLSWPVLTLPARLVGSFIGRLPPGRLGEGYRERLKGLVTEYVHVFVEPLFIEMAGVALLRQGIELGAAFSIIGAAMLIKNILEYHMERMRMLDMVDASIEGKHRVDVLTGAKGPEEAQGYKVSGVRLPASARKMFQGPDAANDDRHRTHESAQA